MRRLALAVALALALATPAGAARIWGGWWRNTPPSTTTSTTSTSTSSSSSSSTSTTSSSTTSSTGVAPTTTSSSTTSTSTSSTTTSTAAGVAPSDWSGSMVAWWDCEEAAHATLINHAGATCGTDCNLADVGGVERDAVDFVEGAQACVYAGAVERHECADATCGTSGTELDCVGSCTFGGWFRPTVDATVRILKKNTSTPGYMLFRESGNDNGSCMVGDGNTVTRDMATGSLPVDTWTHAVCRLNDADDSLQGFANGAESGPAASQGGVAASTNTVTISDATLPVDGQTDEFFVANKALSTPDICRVCSCGILGVRCLCDAIDPTDYKACTVDADCTTLDAAGRCDIASGTCLGYNGTTDPGCGGCTPTACNAAAP